MLRKIATVAAGLAILITAGVLLMPTAKGKKIYVNSKDLPEHGVRLITPGNADFDKELEKEKNKDGDPAAKATLDAIAPFSVFIVNNNGRALVGYTLKWEMTREDGKTLTYFASVSDGDALSGLDTKSSGAGPTLKSGDRRFIALVSQTSQTKGIGTNPAVLTSQDVGAFGTNPASSVLVERLGRQLQHASDLTVSVDNAVFEDGEGVGPDSGHYFDQLQASVRARNDLLSNALNDIRQGRRPEDVISKIREISESELDLGGKQPDIYALYRKEFASEIIRIRASVGDDKTALWYAFQPLTRKWPELRKKDQ
jgi:hypothetical protein